MKTCQAFVKVGWTKTLSSLLRIIHLVSTQNFPKTIISYPVIRTHTCAHQGVRNVSFSENFMWLLNEWFPKYDDELIELISI